MINMDAESIVDKWLTDNKYDGLCKDGCGCDINDLMPCGAPDLSCVPAIRIKVTEENIEDFDGAEVGGFWYEQAR